MAIPGNLLTTAMAVMPHTDVDRALEVALSLDIPFWPQLPRYNYYEDMYVQASEHFPGIVLDLEKRTLRFSMEKFMNELEEAMSHFEEPEYFDISDTYSVVYKKFLQMDFSSRPAIRGQLEGPISFGLNVHDQDNRPILFDDTVRPFMLEFMAKRVNVQLTRLKTLNPNAFMFIDEPGLQFLFSAMAGYGDRAAQAGHGDLFLHDRKTPRRAPVRQSGLGFPAGPGSRHPVHGYLLQRGSVCLLRRLHTQVPGSRRGHRVGHCAHQFRAF